MVCGMQREYKGVVAKSTRRHAGPPQILSRDTPRSETVLQRELQLPHADARAGDHAETAAGGDVRVRIVPVRMVRKIEGFETELELVPVREHEVFVHGKIHADNARRHQGVAAGIAVRACQRDLVDAGVEEPLWILL